MPFGIKAKLDTADAVKWLSLVPELVQKRLLKRALGAAARVILAAAKANAPVETGLLKKSLGTVLKSYRGGTVVVAIIGPRTGFKQEVVRVGGKAAILTTARGKKLAQQGGAVVEFADPTRYSHLVELGTVHAAAKPFLRPAFDGAKGAAVAAFAAVIREGVDKEIAKL